MSQDIGRIATPSASDSAAPPDVRRLADLATEFESMLLSRMLREMRDAGSWKDESEKTGLGNEALFEAIDMELALRLSKAQSLGFRDQVLRQVGQRQVPAAAVRSLPSEGQAALPATVTSGYGWRQDPLTGAAAFHRGIDVRAAYGDNVAAIGAGRVIVAGVEGGYGNTVVLDHGNGLQTRYAHLSAIAVEPGDPVGAGTPLGQAGRSGRATGTHVHFEATLHGRPIDPAELPGRLKSFGLDADLETGGSERWRTP
jgi:murein DD-endopeptidase MepM/ murein hydrolase activator NlpD